MEVQPMLATILLALLGLTPPAETGPPCLFAPPFAVTADGAVIDVPADHKRPSSHHNPYPWFGDFDGDGKSDLLVGQSRINRELHGRGGRLRIYRNIGANGEPQFGDPVMFDSLVPTARIPDG